MNIDDFIQDWVYPAYKTKRLFGFDRYDILHTGLSRFGFAEPDYQILHASFNTFCKWYESKPYEFIDFDSIGIIEGKLLTVHFKELYEYWTKERIRIEADEDYITEVWLRYSNWDCFVKQPHSDYYVMSVDENKKKIKMELFKIEKVNLNWEVLNKYGIKEDTFHTDICGSIKGASNILYKKDQEMFMCLASIRQHLAT